MTTAIDTEALKSLGLQQTPKAKPKDELGQDAFLKLMTTQLQNQDPFKPMESGEFLSQIAQFGTVSGIQELQGSFNSLADALSSNQGLEAVSLVGREVLTPSEIQYLGADGVLKGAADLPQPASDVTVSIYDGAGQLIKDFSLGPQSSGMVNYEWDGVMNDGDSAAPGRYYVAVDAVIGGETIALENLAQSRVNSVTFGGANQALVVALDGLGDKRFSDIRQVR